MSTTTTPGPGLASLGWVCRRWRREGGRREELGVTFGPSHTGGLGSRCLLGQSPFPRARTLTGDADGRARAEGGSAIQASLDGLVEQVDGPSTCGQAHQTFPDVHVSQAQGLAHTRVFSTALCLGGSWACCTWERPSGTRTLAAPGTRASESEPGQQRKLEKWWDGGWWWGNRAAKGYLDREKVQLWSQ